MAYLEADNYAQTRTAPGVQALQHALLWLVGLGGAIVAIEPSPYEFATLSAIIVFFATGLKIRPLFVPLLLLLILINIGYSMTSVPLEEWPSRAVDRVWPQARSRGSGRRSRRPHEPRRTRRV